MIVFRDTNLAHARAACNSPGKQPGPMLEYQSLLILPWALAPGLPAGLARREAAFLQRRAILDAATTAPVGFVCRRRTTGLGRFLGFLRPGPVLEVHETEDEPLVFTIHRGWALAGRWQVYDADRRSVGKLLFGPGSPIRAYLRAQNGTELMVERGKRGVEAEMRLLAFQRAPHELWEEVGKVTRCQEGLRLIFAPEVEGEPFTKMLLLAAVLVTNP